jgi:hypothetical protein
MNHVGSLVAPCLMMTDQCRKTDRRSFAAIASCTLAFARSRRSMDRATLA